ncbi:MAG: WYL domain-containing protein, partial [Anaerotignum sp.]|nr:WYL domain-containing protein [Anaerotignum sp.]
MAYSELIKNFERIRDYMRQFYVYGFKSRTEYDQKSSRSYDNERRRIESWLGDYMSFRQDASGKNIFLSVDSRTISKNPLYNAFRAKSFTAGDITLHFFILDILIDGEKYSTKEIADILSAEYFSHFENAEEPDESTVRKKLKEYVSLGILKSEKQGRELL